jgi:hypothetical protein
MSTANKEKRSKQWKEYYQKNKEKICEKARQAYHDLPVEERQRRVKEKSAKKSAKRAKLKIKKEKNILSVEEKKRLKKEYDLAYRSKNREKRRGYYRKYRQDPNKRLHRLISRNINKSLRSNHLRKSYRKWEDLVGYTLEELKKHLEKQFDKNMTWENRGSYWHIDHIKPQSLFKFTSVDDPEFKECWALSNLQPLEAIANIKKSNKYEESTMYAARKEMPYDIVTEWRRPAEHGGDEVFDIYAQHNDGSFLITKVILIDEDGSEGIFNVASFSDDEIVSIEAALALEWDSNHAP